MAPVKPERWQEVIVPLHTHTPPTSLVDAAASSTACITGLTQLHKPLQGMKHKV